MQLYFSILLMTAGLISAQGQDVPFARFKTHCSELGIYRFDKDEDAWVLLNKLKGNPPKVEMRWNLRLFGPRPRPEPNEKDYYRLYFEFENHDHLGQVMQTYSLALSNIMSESKPVFEIENLPKWVLATLKIPIDETKIVVVLPEDLVIKEDAKDGEQDGTGQPATRPDSGSEGSDKPQPEPEGRSR